MKMMGETLWAWVLIPLVLLVLLYRHLTRNFNHWKDRNVPFQPPVVLFGNMLKVATLRQSLGQLAKEVYDYADSRFTGFFVFDQPFLLVRDPDLIKNILIKDFEHFENRSVYENRKGDELGANLLFVINNPAWKSVRSKLTPVFTSGKMKNMLHLMLEAAEDMKCFVDEKAARDGLVESREMCMKYTTDVISSCAFGINSQSFRHEDAEFRAAARRFFTFSIGRSTQMASYFVAPCLVNLFNMKFMEEKASNFMRSVFWEHMHRRKTSNVKRGDMIDILLQMKEDNKDTLDGEVLVAQALQFFIAGFETTGNTISFALYELALDRKIQIELKEEIQDTLKKHGDISYETIMGMKYLDNVVSETLRKYPPLTFLDRRCNKPYKIPDSEVTIDAGIPIYVTLFGLHMDAKHFPEPDKFKPERFSDKNRGSIAPFTYMPFGEGPRNCIGNRFGLLSVKVALVAILNSFDVFPDDSTPVPIKFDPKSGFLIAPDGGTIPLRFKIST